jgi:hypothetical protein
MFRRFYTTSKLVNDFLQKKNPIIARQYPEEAENNARIIGILLTRSPHDKYLDDIITSYMCAKLNHPWSHEVFAVANAILNTPSQDTRSKIKSKVQQIEKHGY